jgi:hypothetical protein
MTCDHLIKSELRENDSPVGWARFFVSTPNWHGVHMHGFARFAFPVKQR